MKRRFLSVLLLVLCLVVVGGLVSCGISERESGDKTLTVHFVTGFDDVSVADLILDGKEPAVMPRDPVKIGYDFKGWYYDEAFTVPFVIGEEPLTVTQELTLYARWEKLGGGGSSDGGQTEEREGGFLFEKRNDEYAVIGYDGEEKDVVVPATYKGVAVIALSEEAFRNSDIEKITVGSGIVSIGEGAFRNASALTEISVDVKNAHYLSEDGVLYTINKTSLLAVPKNTSLTALVLPATVIGISDYALEGCGLDLTFSDGGNYTEIDSYDLAGFAGSVVIDKNITAIRRHAFAEATCEVTFAPDCVIDAIPMQSFAYYKGRSLVLPGTVENVEAYAFAECTATVDLSKLGLTVIQEHVFGRYKGEQLVVPATVNRVERYAFDGATCEVTFAFGSEYAEVEAYAFAEFGTATKAPGEESVTRKGKVTFSPSVTTVSGTAFYRSYADVVFEASRDEVTVSGEMERFEGTITYKNG